MSDKCRQMVPYHAGLLQKDSKQEETMDHLYRPAEATSAAFGKLVLDRCAIEYGTTNVHELSRRLRIAPLTMKCIFDGTFPGTSPGGKKEFSKKFLQGRTLSLIRICKTLNLDFRACRESCGLPKLALSDSAMHGGLGVLLLEKKDLEFLMTMIEHLGPLHPRDALHLVALSRQNHLRP